MAVSVGWSEPKRKVSLKWYCIGLTAIGTRGGIMLKVVNSRCQGPEGECLTERSGDRKGLR